jgi:putative transposase
MTCNLQQTAIAVIRAQAKRLKELERENAKLKRLLAELSLEKQILKDVAEGNF